MTYLATAHNALILIIAEGAFVANANQCSRSYITVAYRTFPVTLITKAAYGYSWLLSTHDKVAA